MNISFCGAGRNKYVYLCKMLPIGKDFCPGLSENFGNLCNCTVSPVSLWTPYHLCYLFFRRGIFLSTFPILCTCIPSYINTNNWHNKYIDLSIVNLGADYIYPLIYNIPPYSETRTRLRVLAKLCEAQFCDKKHTVYLRYLSPKTKNLINYSWAWIINAVIIG